MKDIELAGIRIGMSCSIIVVHLCLGIVCEIVVKMKFLDCVYVLLGFFTIALALPDPAAVRFEKVEERTPKKTTTTRKQITSSVRTTTSKSISTTPTSTFALYLLMTLSPGATDSLPFPPQPWWPLNLPPIDGKEEYTSLPGPKCFVYEGPKFAPKLPSCKLNSRSL